MADTSHPEDRFRRIEQIYHEALERPEEERRAYLAQACAGDDDLRREVEKLLSFDRKAGSLMESPALDVAAKALARKAERGTRVDFVGQTILHYKVLEKIAEGGMGIVYKALDTHLQRPVAIKVLPPEIVADRERRRRFVQEARAASALNHPNIITIHDISQSDGADFITMEYVSGKTLAELIPRRGMKLSLALKYAVQIADALARAHGAGIIHRDPKPSNIMVDDHGLVKVLDFGLAKLTERVQGDQFASTATIDDEGRPVTEEGVIVGTVSYMSPEQAEGKSIDTRSDIFSFGSMFYEMLTGQRPFRGDTRASTIASILREEPKPIGQVAEGLPREAERIVKRCLRKDLEHRFQTMADLRVTLEELKEESDSGALEAETDPGVTARRKLWWIGVLAGAPVVAMVLGLVLWLVFRITPPPPPPPMTTPLTSSPGFELDPAISPDGKQVAYIGGEAGRRHLYVQLLSGGQATQLTFGASSDRSPTWYPNGSHIAFIRGTPWEPGQDVLAVPALGGPERLLTKSSYLDDGLDLSPDGKLLALSQRDSPDEPVSIWLLSMETGEKSKLSSPPTGGQPRSDIEPAFSPDGRTLAFIRMLAGTGGTGGIYTQPVDADEAREVLAPGSFVWDVDWTADGDALVVSRGMTRVNTHLAIAPVRGGEPSHLPFGQGARHVSIARQGGRMVYSRWLEDNNIWRVGGPLAKEQGPSTKLIASTLDDRNPDFSPDATKIVFISDRSGSSEIWCADADGSNLRQLTDRGHAICPAWSPDSREVAFSSVLPALPDVLAKELHRTFTSDVYVVDRTGGFARRLTDVRWEDALPSWSANGQWVYYQSGRGEEHQIWKMPVAGGDSVQLTASVGMKFRPLESGDGRVFYWCDGIWGVPVNGGEEKLILDAEVGLYEWRPWNGKIVYIRQGQSDPSIVLFDYEKQEKIPLHTFEPRTRLGAGLAVSPDGRWILYTQCDQYGSDLMLVENFR